MYRFLCAILMISVIVDTANAQNGKNMNSTNNDNMILIAYFSATGTTEQVAEKLAVITGGELYAITPSQPYTSSDLNWNNKRSRSSMEMNSPEIRPSLVDKKLDMENYNVVFIGYPIWWNLAPRIINTFIENYNLQGKTIVPFATSGGSGISNSVATLKKTYPELNWQEGKLLNHINENNIREWIEQFGY